MSLNPNGYKSLLLLVAGAKGAIGSTLAAAVSMLKHHPERVLPYLTTAGKFPSLFPQQAVDLAGWDVDNHPMTAAISRHGVLPNTLWEPFQDEIDQVKVFSPPGPRPEQDGTGSTDYSGYSIPEIQFSGCTAGFYQSAAGLCIRAITCD